MLRISKGPDVDYQGAGIANIAKITRDHLNPNLYESGSGLQIQTSLALFSTFTLTLIVTSLIVYRLITVAQRTDLQKRTKYNCRMILDLIIQSSAVYMVALIIWGISWIVSPLSINSSGAISPGFLVKFVEELSFISAVRPTHF